MPVLLHFGFYKNSKNSLWDVPITTNLIEELEHDSENDKFSLFFDESKTIRDDWFPPVYNSDNLNFKIFSKNFLLMNSNLKKKTDDDTDENCVSLKDFVVHCLKQKLYEFHDIASNILAAILPIASQILLTCRNGLKFNSVLPIIMILSEVCENDKIIKTICARNGSKFRKSVCSVHRNQLMKVPLVWISRHRRTIFWYRAAAVRYEIALSFFTRPKNVIIF